MERNPHDRKRMRVALDGGGGGGRGGAGGTGGRHAATRVVTVARGPTADLVRCTLETGRTHQIRVHLMSIGHPVVGDATYGGLAVRRSDATRREAEALARLTPRQALHAAWLQLPHPATGEPIDVRAEWPADLLPALAQSMGEPGLLAETKPLQYLGFFASGEPM